MNPPTLSPEQRLERAVSFIARSAGTTAADVETIAETLTALVVDRPALLDLDWPSLTETLVLEGAELELWSPEVRADLDRRVAAAYKRRDRRPWTKPTPKWQGGGPQNYVVTEPGAA